MNRLSIPYKLISLLLVIVFLCQNTIRAYPAISYNTLAPSSPFEPLFLVKQQTPDTGYRHFFYEEREGRSYLVYRRERDDGTVEEREWEQGAGGRFVPDTITVDDDANESLILELLDRMYDKGEQFTSCSADGQLYIREGANGELHLVKRTASGFWEEEPSEKDIFRPRAKRLSYQQKGDHREFANKKARISYRLDKEGRLEILRSGDNWLPAAAEERFTENVQVRYLSSLNRYAVYDNKRKLVLVDKETGTAEILALSEHKEQSLVLMKGETGLGKDEIVRAAAKLMNEEVFYITCHEEMTRTGLIARRVLINGESRPLYSPLTYVQHNGGWCVLSEFNYMAPEAKGTLKKSLRDNTHSWYYSNKDGRRQRNDHVHNHPRGRYLATTNTGIIERENWAISDRQEEMHFVWRYPPDEVNLQVELAKRSLTKAIARGQRKPLTQAEYDAEIERISEKAKKMVAIATQLRFVYMGFVDTQRNELLRLSKVKGKEAQVEARKDWYEKLRSDSFCKIKGRPGDKLKRAPSPRVLANILQYALNYPNSWQHSPWAVIEMYFNFEVNQLSYRDKEIHMEKVRNRFQAADQDEMFTDGAKVEPVILDAKEGRSFRYEGDTLMVVPYNREGKENKYWDKIRIRIPKGMQRQVNKAIVRWLSTGNEENSRVLYHLLQFRALGKSPILIGEQGTGKTELAEATQVLLSGLELAKQVDSETKFSELTWKMELEAGGNSYPEEGVVLQGAQAWEGEGATVLLDEIAAGPKNVVGGLNEIVERGYVVMPDGSVYYAGDLFGFIFTANPPGGPFEVEAPHDAFIERCPVIVMKPLPIEQMYDFLLKEKGHLGESVNWNVIGHLPKAADNKPVTKDSEGNEYPEGRWQGLVGVVQYLRGAVDRQRNKRVIPRIPGFRTFKRMFRKMINSWDSKCVFPGMNEQEKLWAWFNSCFVQEGTAKEKAAWEELLKQAFKESGLWSDDGGKDAVAEYLNGEDMIIRVDEPEWYREPDSENAEIDQILAYIQKVTRGKGLKDRLNKLAERVRELIGEEGKWLELDFLEELEIVYELREIYQIVKLAREQRGLGVKAGNYLDDEYNFMETNILKSIRIKLVGKEGWPPSFFKQCNNWLELKALWGELPATWERELDGLLGKLAVNIDNQEYVEKMITMLKEEVDKQAAVFPGKPLHDIVGELSLLLRMFAVVLKMVQNKKPLVEFYEYLEKVVNNSPLSIAQLKELGNISDMSGLETMGLPGIDAGKPLAEAAAEVLSKLAEDSEVRDEMLERLQGFVDELPRLYRWQVVTGAYAESEKEQKEYIKTAKNLDQILKKVIDSMAVTPEQEEDAGIMGQLEKIVSAIRARLPRKKKMVKPLPPPQPKPGRSDHLAPVNWPVLPEDWQEVVKGEQRKEKWEEVTAQLAGRPAEDPETGKIYLPAGEEILILNQEGDIVDSVLMPAVIHQCYVQGEYVFAATDDGVCVINKETMFLERTLYSEIACTSVSVDQEANSYFVYVSGQGTAGSVLKCWEMSAQAEINTPFRSPMVPTAIFYQHNYIIVAGQRRIVIVDTEKRDELSLAYDSGDLGEEFAEITDVAVDEWGFIYLLRENGPIAVFSRSGELNEDLSYKLLPVGEISLLADVAPCGITVCQDGSLLVASLGQGEEAGRLLRIPRSDVRLPVYYTNGDKTKCKVLKDMVWQNYLEDEGIEDTKILQDVKGFVYFCDEKQNKIYILRRSKQNAELSDVFAGVPLEYSDLEKVAGLIPVGELCYDDCQRPRALVVRKNGMLMILDGGGEVIGILPQELAPFMGEREQTADAPVYWPVLREQWENLITNQDVLQEKFGRGAGGIAVDGKERKIYIPTGGESIEGRNNVVVVNEYGMLLDTVDVGEETYDCCVTENHLFVATRQGVYAYHKDTLERDVNIPVIGEGSMCVGVAVRGGPEDYEVFVTSWRGSGGLVNNVCRKYHNSNNYSAAVIGSNDLKGVPRALRFTNDGKYLLITYEKKFALVDPDKLKGDVYASCDDVGKDDFLDITEDENGFIYAVREYAGVQIFVRSELKNPNDSRRLILVGELDIPPDPMMSRDRIRPEGIEIMPDGSLYVVSKGGDGLSSVWRVRRSELPLPEYRGEGRKVAPEKFREISQMSGFGVDPVNGDIFVAMGIEGKVAILDKNWNFKGEKKFIEFPATEVHDCWLTSKHLFVATKAGVYVYKKPLTEEDDYVLDESFGEDGIIEKDEICAGVAVNEISRGAYYDYEIFVSNYNGWVKNYSWDSELEIFTDPEGVSLKDPRRMCFFQDGEKVKLAVTYESNVAVIDPEQMKVEADSGFIRDLSGACGVAVDKRGYLYVTGANSDQTLVFAVSREADNRLELVGKISHPGELKPIGIRVKREGELAIIYSGREATDDDPAVPPSVVEIPPAIDIASMSADSETEDDDISIPSQNKADLEPVFWPVAAKDWQKRVSDNRDYSGNIDRVAVDDETDKIYISEYSKVRIVTLGGENEIQEEEGIDLGITARNCFVSAEYLFVATDKGIHVYDKKTRRLAITFAGSDNGIIAEGTQCQDVAAIKKNGRWEIFVASSNDEKIIKYKYDDAEEKYVLGEECFELSPLFGAMNVTHDNKLVVTVYHTIYLLDPETLEQVALPFESKYPEHNRLGSIVEDSNGFLYIACQEGHKIIILQRIVQADGKEQIVKYGEIPHPDDHWVNCLIIRDGKLVVFNHFVGGSGKPSDHYITISEIGPSSNQPPVYGQNWRPLSAQENDLGGEVGYPAVDEEKGRIYIPTGERGTVAVTDSVGKVLAKEEMHLGLKTNGCAVTAEYVFVATEKYVRVFMHDGTLAEDFASGSTIAGGSNCLDVAVRSTENDLEVFVTVRKGKHTNQLLVFDNTNGYAQPVRFKTLPAVGLCFTKDNKLAATTLHGGVYIFDPDTLELISKCGVGGGFYENAVFDIAEDDRGYLYVGGFVNNKIDVYRRDEVDGEEKLLKVRQLVHPQGGRLAGLLEFQGKMLVTSRNTKRPLSLILPGEKKKAGVQPVARPVVSGVDINAFVDELLAEGQAVPQALPELLPAETAVDRTRPTVWPARPKDWQPVIVDEKEKKKIPRDSNGLSCVSRDGVFYVSSPSRRLFIIESGQARELPALKGQGPCLVTQKHVFLSNGNHVSEYRKTKEGFVDGKNIMRIPPDVVQLAARETEHGYEVFCAGMIGDTRILLKYSSENRAEESVELVDNRIKIYDQNRGKCTHESLPLPKEAGKLEWLVEDKNGFIYLFLRDGPVRIFVRSESEASSKTKLLLEVGQIPLPDNFSPRSAVFDKEGTLVVSGRKGDSTFDLHKLPKSRLPKPQFCDVMPEDCREVPVRLHKLQGKFGAPAVDAQTGDIYVVDACGTIVRIFDSNWNEKSLINLGVNVESCSVTEEFIFIATGMGIHVYNKDAAAIAQGERPALASRLKDGAGIILGSNYFYGVAARKIGKEYEIYACSQSEKRVYKIVLNPPTGDWQTSATIPAEGVRNVFLVRMAGEVKLAVTTNKQVLIYDPESMQLEYAMEPVDAFSANGVITDPAGYLYSVSGNPKHGCFLLLPTEEEIELELPDPVDTWKLMTKKVKKLEIIGGFKLPGQQCCLGIAKKNDGQLVIVSQDAPNGATHLYEVAANKGPRYLQLRSLPPYAHVYKFHEQGLVTDKKRIKLSPEAIESLSNRLAILAFTFRHDEHKDKLFGFGRSRLYGAVYWSYSALQQKDEEGLLQEAWHNAQEETANHYLRSLAHTHVLDLLVQAGKFDDCSRILGVDWQQIAKEGWDTNGLVVAAQASQAISYLISVLSQAGVLIVELNNPALKNHTNENLIDLAYRFAKEDALALCYYISVIAEVEFEGKDERIGEAAQKACDLSFQIDNHEKKNECFAALITALDKVGWTRAEIINLRPAGLDGIRMGLASLAESSCSQLSGQQAARSKAQLALALFRTDWTVEEIDSQYFNLVNVLADDMQLNAALDETRMDYDYVLTYIYLFYVLAGMGLVTDANDIIEKAINWIESVKGTDSVPKEALQSRLYSFLATCLAQAGLVEEVAKRDLLYQASQLADKVENENHQRFANEMLVAALADIIRCWDGEMPASAPVIMKKKPEGISAWVAELIQQIGAGEEVKLNDQLIRKMLVEIVSWSVNPAKLVKPIKPIKGYVNSIFSGVDSGQLPQAELGAAKGEYNKLPLPPESHIKKNDTVQDGRRLQLATPDGKYSVVVENGNEMTWWSLKNDDEGEEGEKKLDVWSFNHDFVGTVSSLRFTSDGRFLAMGVETEVRLYEVKKKNAAGDYQPKTKTELEQTFKAAPFVRFECISDGFRSDGSDAGTASPKRVVAFDISPDDKYLAIVVHDCLQYVALTDEESGAYLEGVILISRNRFFAGEEMRVVRFSPRGDYLAVGTNKALCLYPLIGIAEMLKNRFVDAGSVGDTEIASLDFSPGGEFLAAGGKKNIRFYRLAYDIGWFKQMPHLGDVVNIRPSFVSADLDGPVTGLSFSTNGTALTAAAGKSFYVWHKSQGEVGGEGEVKEELVTVPATEEDLLRRLVSIVVAEEGVLQENIVERIMRKLQKGQVVKNVVVASPELLAAVRWLMVCHQPGHVEEALEVLEKQSAEIKAQPWFQILVSKILECQTNPDIKQRLTQLLGEEENAEVETSI